jgi:hypothetical protein
MYGTYSNCTVEMMVKLSQKNYLISLSAKPQFSAMVVKNKFFT